MKNLIVRFAKDESGATAIEYGLIAALIAVVIITVLTTLGTRLNTKFQAIADNLDFGGDLSGADMQQRGRRQVGSRSMPPHVRKDRRPVAAWRGESRAARQLSKPPDRAARHGRHRSIELTSDR